MNDTIQCIFTCFALIVALAIIVFGVGGCLERSDCKTRMKEHSAQEIVQICGVAK